LCSLQCEDGYAFNSSSYAIIDNLHYPLIF